MHETQKTNYLRLSIDNKLNWKESTIDETFYSYLCCKSYLSLFWTRELVYAVYFHYLLAHGMKFGGDSSEVAKVFITLKTGH